MCACGLFVSAMAHKTGGIARSVEMWYDYKSIRRPGDRWQATAGGKSGLHDGKAAGNARPVSWATGEPRDSATESKPPIPVRREARVKGCGKSAPRSWKQGRHGKPRLEQDRIGTGVEPIPREKFDRRAIALRPGWSREAVREDRPRGMVAYPLARAVDRTRLTGRLIDLALRFPVNRSRRSSPRLKASESRSNLDAAHTQQTTYPHHDLSSSPIYLVCSRNRALNG
jgi:hypothetical protein